MKRLATFLVVTVSVVPFFTATGDSPARAQSTQNPSAQIQDQPTQAQQSQAQQSQAQQARTHRPEKQRDSAEPRQFDHFSGVKSRRKPDAASMTPDTSYSTITNAPSSTSGTAANERAGLQESGRTNLPESMRIQQETIRALPPRRDLITKGGGPAAPGVVNSSLEHDRVDSAAPSRQRLQIDDLSATRPQEPNATPGTTPATVPAVNGAANGSSTGVSGFSEGSTAINGSRMSSGGFGAAGSVSSHSAASSSSSSGGGR